MEAHTRKVQVSLMAYNLIASEILTIANQIRGLKAQGRQISDFTVGDFAKGEFRIPEQLTELVIQQYREGNTNYPPSKGVPELRTALAEFCKKHMGTYFDPECIQIAGGSRPLIYGIYATIVDPGDMVVYGVPSWNNNHYCHISGAVPRQIDTKRENNFLLTAEELEPYIDQVVLVALNTPSNPTGTMYTREQLEAICDLVLKENESRERRGAKPVYVMFDQMYFLLTFGGRSHVHPVGLRPEMAPYTVYVDGISKYFAATGVRVGWSMGPETVMRRLSGILSHLGAWAPKPEQLATAAYLQLDNEIDTYITALNKKLEARLQKIHAAVQAWKAEGLPVDSIEPMGGIYLSVNFHIKGYTTPSGEVIRNADMVRQYVLDEADTAVVPYEAFGDKHNDGWCRISVGGVTDAELDAALTKLPIALRRLKWSK